MYIIFQVAFLHVVIVLHGNMMELINLFYVRIGIMKTNLAKKAPMSLLHCMDYESDYSLGVFLYTLA